MNSGQNVNGFNASHLGFSQDENLQSSDSVPQTSNNSLQGTGSGSSLTNSNNAANLLNQTQVLGSSSVGTSKVTEINPNNSSVASYGVWILIVAVIFVAVFYFFVRKAEN